MSTIKSSDEHLTLNADGSGNDIKFQSNGSEVASISDGGVVTATSFAGSGASLTSLPNGSQLDHSGTKKFEATASGVTLTGTTGTSPILELNNADTEDNDTGRESSLRYTGKRSGGEDVVNAQISGHHDGSADDDKGMMLFYTNNGSGLSQQLKITNDGRGLSQFTAKAWVNFQGSGTVNIKDSHNVSSISDNSTGNYSLSLANNLGNNHGVMSGYSIMDGLVYGDANNVSDAASFRFRTVVGSSNALFDSDEVHCIIFGD